MKFMKHSKLKSGLTLLGLSLGAALLPGTSQAFDYPERGDFAQGAKEWAENCNRCHNIRGAKELRDDQWITTIFHMRVRAGLTGQEMRNILTFLQDSNDITTGEMLKMSTSTTTAAASSGLSGKDIYNQTCVACHGSNGKGVLPGVPDFTRSDGRLSKPDDVLLKHVSEGFQSPGSPMAMPPKGGNSSLTEGDLKNVLEYLHQAFGS